MSRANVTISFHGPAVDAGEIDIADLAPALLHFSDIFKEAHRALDLKTPRPQVMVKATAANCFSVDISIIQSMTEQILELGQWGRSHESELEGVDLLLDLLMKGSQIVGGVAFGTVGLIAAIKAIGGNKPVGGVGDPEKGLSALVMEDGSSIEFDPRVSVLLRDEAVRKKAQSFVGVLKSDGIEKLEVSGDGIELMQLLAEDLPAFEIPEQENEELEPPIISHRTLNLRILSLSFKGDNMWRFTAGDENFLASIADAEFLNKIANNEIAFAKGDYLRCQIKETQIFTESGLKYERIVEKVENHITGARQLKLI